jgi:hypothetical protein
MLLRDRGIENLKSMAELRVLSRLESPPRPNQTQLGTTEQGRKVSNNLLMRAV